MRFLHSRHEATKKTGKTAINGLIFYTLLESKLNYSFASPLRERVNAIVFAGGKS
jgi:hypothetical protein